MTRMVWVLYSTEKAGFVSSMTPVVKTEGEKRVPKMEAQTVASPHSDKALVFEEEMMLEDALCSYCTLTKTTVEEMFPADRFIPVQVEATEFQMELLGKEVA